MDQVESGMPKVCPICAMVIIQMDFAEAGEICQSCEFATHEKKEQ